MMHDVVPGRRARDRYDSLILASLAWQHDKFSGIGLCDVTTKVGMCFYDGSQMNVRGPFIGQSGMTRSPRGRTVICISKYDFDSRGNARAFN
jgi:hypothetical protein